MREQVSHGGGRPMGRRGGSGLSRRANPTAPVLEMQRMSAVADDDLVIMASVEVLGNGVYLHLMPGRLTSREALKLGKMLIEAARELEPNIESECGQ